MEFNSDARVDTSQIEDARGRGGGGGGGGFGLPGGIPLPTGAGGNMGCLGVVGIIIFLAIQFFTSGSGGTGGGFDPQGGNGVSTQNLSAGDTGADIQSCNTDPNFLKRDDCRLALIINSVNAFWTQYLPQATPQKVQYRTAVTQLYTQGTQTGCGQATSAVGPFYCPNDEKAYIDMSFFSNELQQLGATNTEFVQAYVVAHEYGHHIQNILGILQQGQQMDQSGPSSGAVRIELMADCLAGVWANHATGTTDSSGVKIIKSISDQDIQSGLDAATKIGDDHIQQQTQGQVNPESFTHGTSKQRYNWFKKGIDTGELGQCDTFSGGI
ncbi:KPN_02809 family neutral zinc metallopeptidase [Cumulibacter manganitolerans]|uniref:KPN_02809 family neutral zinc metallopeptidase n=1 Tax=Cumulibacter manganitolerans TaxID=1884992 RepID=UPI0012972BAC|nr:neutral zinc metallopeptidase [Cumulibacter manganitolerans]